MGDPFLGAYLVGLDRGGIHEWSNEADEDAQWASSAFPDLRFLQFRTFFFSLGPGSHYSDSHSSSPNQLGPAAHDAEAVPKPHCQHLRRSADAAAYKRYTTVNVTHKNSLHPLSIYVPRN